MAYIKTVYQDSPSTATPLNAQHLNNSEDGIENNDRRLNALEAAGVVNTFNGRRGAVVPESGDYNIEQISPLNGAQVGQVPVVVNEGTEQDPKLVFKMGAGGSNGHIIQNSSGTDMTQRNTMQFLGLEVTDDSINGKTIIDATDKVTWEANGILGAKNLIPYPFAQDSYSQRDIDFTCLSDGTINANGTNDGTGNSTFNFVVITLSKGTYIINGCPTQTDNNYRCGVVRSSDSTTLAADYGSGANFTLDADTQVRFFVQVLNKKTANNIIFKPMLRLTEDTDPTYQPYAMTNRELTLDKASQAEVDDILNVYGAKQMIEYPYQEGSVTRNGITYTDNGDGTITANGTATADASFYMHVNVTQLQPIKAGNYTLTNGLSDNSISTYRMRIRLTTDHGTTYNSVDLIGESVTFNVEQDCEYAIYLWVVSGKTVSNVTFKPLLTPASVTNRTYQPYAMTNYELTQKIRELETAIIELGGN